VDGYDFLAMEYVDGEDLASLLRRIGRLPEERAVRMARELCAGLAAAHREGILHRDLKPANVMVDGRGRVKLADFGLAAASADLEGTDVRSGTPAYMSPEQLAGREVTVRSDVYALGPSSTRSSRGASPFPPRHWRRPPSAARPPLRDPRAMSRTSTLPSSGRSSGASRPTRRSDQRRPRRSPRHCRVAIPWRLPWPPARRPHRSSWRPPEARVAFGSRSRSLSSS